MSADLKLVAVDAGRIIWLFPDGQVGISGEGEGSIMKTYPSMSVYLRIRGEERRQALNEWRIAKGAPAARLTGNE